jgi:hypothetical protein
MFRLINLRLTFNYEIFHRILHNIAIRYKRRKQEKRLLIDLNLKVLLYCQNFELMIEEK